MNKLERDIRLYFNPNSVNGLQDGGGRRREG
jgi:hypothetical protein